MTPNKEETTKLKIETLPADFRHPILKVGLTQQLSLLFGSFGTALGFAATLCGCLATIMITHQVMESDQVEVLETITIHNVESVEETSETPPPQKPLYIPLSRPPVAPIFPSNKMAYISVTLPDTAEIPEIPDFEPRPLDPMDFEELEIDNPFVTNKKASKKTAQKKATTSKPSQKTAAQKLAAKKKREAAHRASLAKKIVRKASVISRASPTYPKSARRKKIEGRVIVTVTIGTSGRVSSSLVHRSSGNASLDAAALKAARKFRFKPARNGLGQAKASRKHIPFDFSLQ